MTKIKKTIDFQVHFNATILSTILRKRRFSAEKKGDFTMSVDVTKMPKLGFGMMRLPEKDGELDLEQICKMVDAYLASGMNYFDTAYTYLDGKSEWAIRESLVKRHPRSSFLLADKLPGYKMTSHEDCYQYFKEQQDRCQVDFFDVYLLHWLNGKHYEIAEKYRDFYFLA